MKRLFALVPVLAFVILAAYFAKALISDRDPNELPSALLDRPVPGFVLPGLAASDFAGKLVVVNFFASWCVPCRIEHPSMLRLSRNPAVTLYGIAYKDKDADSAKFLADLGNPYLGIGADRDGRAGIDFGVYGVPETYVIDRAGRIRQRYVGPMTLQRLDQELLPLLARLSTP